MAALFYNSPVILMLCYIWSVSSLSPKVIEEKILWERDEQGEVAEFRIPLLIQVPTGDLLAFSEARKYSGGDAGAKFIAMRRSTDGGDNWGPTAFILDDYHTVPDGTNLGTITIEHETNKLILIHTFCIHSTPSCMNGTGEKPKGLYMVTSSDWGYSWSKQEYLGDKDASLKGIQYNPGPGYGIQKKYEPNKGRLVSCGQGLTSMFCLTSDDLGLTWQMTPGILNLPQNREELKIGDFEPGEVQVVELKNGTLLINARNERSFHCTCRIQALSFDGGKTFPLPHVTFKEELIDPQVCGSILNYNDTLIFSNPFNAKSRINLTLHWSTDSGETYPHFFSIHPAGSGYSCLTTIDENHIGLIYEKNDCRYISFLKIQLNP
nr:sialidase-1-like [Lytechinus pictus]